MTGMFTVLGRGRVFNFYTPSMHRAGLYIFSGGSFPEMFYPLGFIRQYLEELIGLIVTVVVFATPFDIWFVVPLFGSISSSKH